MTVHVSLPNASLFYLRGWRRQDKRDDHDYVVRMEDFGELNVYRQGLWRRRLMSMSIEHLTLTVGVEQFRTRGSWVGFGTTGVAIAALMAELGNHRWERAVLHADVTLLNGAKKLALFGFRIDESELRDRIAAGYDSWADSYVHAQTSGACPNSFAGLDLDGIYTQVDRMVTRHTITPAQRRVLCSHASVELVQQITDRLQATTSPDEARALLEHIGKLRHADHIDDSQAAMLRQQARLVIANERREPTRQQQRELEALTSLRASGVLTQAELEDEQRRILGTPRDVSPDAT